MSASERLTKNQIEELRERVLAWIPGRVAKLDRAKFANNASLAIMQFNALCDLALRALDSDNALSFTVAQADCILKCRDALIAREYDEVWHQLYMLQTKQSNYDPFAPWINLEILVQNADNAAGRDHQPVESEFPPSQAPVPAAPEPRLVNADECLWII